MRADRDTICAVLLHDTIENSDFTKEDIEMQFNKDVANLVDGVTKISKLNFSSREEPKPDNTRKINELDKKIKELDELIIRIKAGKIFEREKYTHRLHKSFTVLPKNK